MSAKAEAACNCADGQKIDHVYWGIPARRQGRCLKNLLPRLHRDLDPGDSLGELIFGLIMVLTFTLGSTPCWR